MTNIAYNQGISMRHYVIYIFLCLYMTFSDALEMPEAHAQHVESNDMLDMRQDTTHSISEKSYIALYPHKAVYILPFYHSISEPLAGNKDTETKFQFSFKLNIVDKLFSPHSRLYFAYTQTSWFQNYNVKDSRPFRDIDYQPELFYSYEKSLYFLGGAIKDISFGYNHLSNGERALRSRTQNRVMLKVRWEYDTLRFGVFGLNVGAWTYIGKNRDGYMHDNPDIHNYRGYNDINIYYKSNRHLLEAYMRPPISIVYYPFFELGYTFRVSDNVGLYVQYVNGYGDNIFEYKTRSERVGVGIRLWDK